MKDRFDDDQQQPFAEIFQHAAQILAPDSLLVDSQVELRRSDSIAMEVYPASLS